MIRRLFTIASGVSLVLCAVAIVLGWSSYQHPHTFAFRSHKGAPWYAALEDGEFSIYNDTARMIRAINAAEADLVERDRAVADLAAKWQRRPDRFEKSKDSLVKDLADAELAVGRDEEQAVRLQMQLKAWARRGIVPPAPARHSIRCSILAAAALLLPLLWIISLGLARRRRALRARRSLCRTCGYDVRASPDRCPECGTLVATGKSNSA